MQNVYSTPGWCRLRAFCLNDVEMIVGLRVMADRWGDEDIGGIVGSTIGGGGYAFAGDGYWFVKAIVPLPRYAPQYGLRAMT